MKTGISYRKALHIPGFKETSFTPEQISLSVCVREEEVFYILKSSHDEPCGGHFADKRTAYKVLRAGSFWPSLFKDAKQYVK